MKIEHVAMYVNNLEQAKDFFVGYLDGKANEGYHNQTTDFRSYFISFGDGARLEIMNKPGIPGGVVLASAAIAESVLGFTPERYALVIATYMALDGMGTACNLTGDGAIALIVDRFNSRPDDAER